ncbi:calreticulin/calnexin [Kipferlia bialata]|uniref:Calreticulin/calnexin n=1 Tax=Kipferlia bialata TaxID=797122 RepID=A0A9K3CTE7_9EUKA|nr:calreticulin/calnexin [Kipferlia bialata]|eukprot:g4151.t1
MRLGPSVCGKRKRHLKCDMEIMGDLLPLEMEPAIASDLRTHQVTLALHSDTTVSVYVDGREEVEGDVYKLYEIEGSLPLRVPDPNARPPKDMPARYIPDPANPMPPGYESIPHFIPDPYAVRPEAWDERLDGEWVPPLTQNPEYVGDWDQAFIPNPDYIPWRPPMIDNPDFIRDVTSIDVSIGSVGFDLYEREGGIWFGQITITDDWDTVQASMAQFKEDAPKEEAEILTAELL